tara:strand:+ start:1314 stop:1466 length:153 start_codon:yes stop_codon:yes gene_type:complete
MAARGLGDSVENFTKATGIKKVVDKISEVTGKPCGCSKRRDTLNRILPYK